MSALPLRVGRYKFTALVPTGVLNGTYLGIDRLTFPSAAYWQRDFADEQLGVLMNQLAANPSGILVPSSLLEEKKSEGG